MSDGSRWLFPLLSMLPWTSVWIVAAVVAAIRWTKHPVVSALVVTASALHVVASVMQAVLPITLHERGVPVAQMGIFLGGVGLVGLVGSVCLVVAVFIGRQDERPPSVTHAS